MGQGQGPFEPPWEDQAMQLRTSNGCKCFLFDTCCKALITGGEKRAHDREIADIYLEAYNRKRRGEAEEEGETAPDNI